MITDTHLTKAGIYGVTLSVIIIGLTIAMGFLSQSLNL